MSVQPPSADGAPAALSSTPRPCVPRQARKTILGLPSGCTRATCDLREGAQRHCAMGGRGAPRLTQSSLAVGVVGVAYVNRQRLAQNRSTVLPPFNTHNLVHEPKEVLNRAARVFGMSGYMLGERLLLCLLLPRLGLGLVVAFVDG
jgi:hypothetical protein